MTDIKRRVFLKGGLAAGAVGVAVGAGLLTPRLVLAEWNESAFKAKSSDEALSALGDSLGGESGEIQIKAPEIAENGAVVPVTVESSLTEVESIALLVEQNGTPLTALFMLKEGAEAYVSTRIKMGKTSNVIAVVKAGGQTLHAKKEVKVTIGGCGG